MRRRTAVVGLILASVVLVALVLGRVPWNSWRSLASLQRIDDLPLYVMHIYGDYGLGDFVSSETRTSITPAYPREQSEGWACSVFSAMGTENERVLGRNFDWHNHQALLLFTDPSDGYASASMVDVSYLQFPQNGATWIDRRRLLDAPYWPFDGLNEQGLAVGMMAVPHARDRIDPSRRTIGSLHAIRLMLDYAASVEQAIELLGQYNIDFEGGPPVHYLVADASGTSAVIEYIDGEMVFQYNDQTWQIATNFVVHDVRPKGADAPCWRYSHLYEELAHVNGRLTISQAMTLLSDVSQPNTMWSVVYNMVSGDISVVMDRQYDKLRSFALQAWSRAH